LEPEGVGGEIRVVLEAIGVIKKVVEVTIRPKSDTLIAI